MSNQKTFPMLNVFYRCPYPRDNIQEGLGGAVEVDEAEDYEAPGSNPGQEL